MCVNKHVVENQCVRPTLSLHVLRILQKYICIDSVCHDSVLFVVFLSRGAIMCVPNYLI